MSALASTYFHQPRLLGRGSRASSEASRTVRSEFEDAKRHARSAASALQSQAYSKLAGIMSQCAVRGWDGYEAMAITPATYARVEAFIDDLPSSLPAPDIVPEADGDVAIEWDFGPQYVFSISIGEAGFLNFAGQFGPGVERHGVDPFDGVVSEEILGYIRKLNSARLQAAGSCRAA
jgi:hypothetical protein